MGRLGLHALQLGGLVQAAVDEADRATRDRVLKCLDPAGTAIYDLEGGSTGSPHFAGKDRRAALGVLECREQGHDALAGGCREGAVGGAEKGYLGANRPALALPQLGYPDAAAAAGKGDRLTVDRDELDPRIGDVAQPGPIGPRADRKLPAARKADGGRRKLGVGRLVGEREAGRTADRAQARRGPRELCLAGDPAYRHPPERLACLNRLALHVHPKEATIEAGAAGRGLPSVGAPLFEYSGIDPDLVLGDVDPPERPAGQVEHLELLLASRRTGPLKCGLQAGRKTVAAVEHDARNDGNQRAAGPATAGQSRNGPRRPWVRSRRQREQNEHREAGCEGNDRQRPSDS